MLEHLATGDWLTRARVRRVAVLSLMLTIVIVATLSIGAHGTVDMMGRPLGTDFANVWAAGRMANEGRAALAWDWEAHHAVQIATHGAASMKEFFAWHYPPPFLLMAAALALLPYLWALIVWQSVTLVLALLLFRQVLPGRDALIAALGFPAVMVCLGHGHNGFLTATLLGGGLWLIDRRPFVAGLLIGCLIYKPQFALILPIFLLAGWHWRAILGALCSAGLLVGLTLALWGWPVWQAFLNSLPLTQTVIIEQGITGWPKIQSAFSALRMWGGSIPTAYAAQFVVTGAAMMGALLAALRLAPGPRGAVVIAASLLSTPYLLDYDLVVLGIAIAFLVVDGRARGFLRWEKSLYALAWATPLFGRSLMTVTGIPFGFIAIAAIFVLAIRRGIVLDDALGWIRSSPFRRSHVGSGQ